MSDRFAKQKTVDVYQHGLNAAIDQIEWKEELPPKQVDPRGLPYVTHSGVLKMLDLEMTVYQLSSGERVFPEPELEKFWAWLEK